MALVSYGYDSDENLEEEEEEETEASTGSAVIIPPQTNISESKTNSLGRSETKIETTVNGNLHDNVEDILNNSQENPAEKLDLADSILSQLPKPQTTTNQIVQNNAEDEIEDFIPKASKVEKKKEKVKIMIPSLAEFKDEDSDDEESTKKKVKQFSKGSSLMALLPPVKNEPLSNKSFVPKSVTQKSKAAEQKPEASKSLIPNTVRRRQLNASAIAAKEKKTSTLSKDIQESDDEDDIVIPETFDDEVWEKVCGRPKQKSVQREDIVEDTFTPQEVNIAPEPEEPYAGLDNAAFKELVGKKRKAENITIRDINEDDIMPDKDLWMVKSITDPECAPKTVIEDPVDPTKRRKHHITYLAQQAKANEQELQNQWSASKFNRNQTRAKYGF